MEKKRAGRDGGEGFEFDLIKFIRTQPIIYICYYKYFFIYITKYSKYNYNYINEYN